MLDVIKEQTATAMFSVTAIPINAFRILSYFSASYFINRIDPRLS